ncbi:MAG: hypothetical protein C4581_04740 [Nitrospiraceae bacterium]|nr:MAG: hypothetical protein C4581_04740 [Nitrospiraceae bacterium]
MSNGKICRENIHWLASMLIFVLMFGAAGSTFASLAQDGAATNSSSTTATVSWNHTIGTGSNRLLVVGVSYDARNSNTVSSVTLGSTNLTKLRGEGTGAANARTEIWYLTSPASGTNTITVVIGGTLTGQRNMAGAVSYTGVDQTTPFSSDNGAVGSSGAAPTVNVTSAAGNLVFDIFCTFKPATTPAVGAGQTQYWKNTTSGNAGVNGGMSRKAGAASVTMSWTGNAGSGTGNVRSISAASIKAVPVACIDLDGDGYGSNGANTCPKGIAVDCNDNDPTVYPGAPEICDGKDNNCDGWKPTTDIDKDGDGVPMCANDCNDDDPTIYPGAPELCDGKDNNCDYIIPMNERDVDGDGYRTCDVPGDCNDNDPFINPGMQEWCSDNKDNNCNGQKDEVPCICPDADNDGFTASFCGGTDCVDTDPVIYPGAPEICSDGKDNNCNSAVDCKDSACSTDTGCLACIANDRDGDGFSTLGGICGKTDCDDNDPKVYPGAPEICDGKDSNCDGWKPPTDVDADGDGVPLCASDCDDNNPNRFPGNREICTDGIDNDCDYMVDAVDPDCKFSCNTKTSPKNGPHMFDLKDPANGSTIKTSCNWCHYDSTGAIDQRALCQRCHADPADTSDPINGKLKQQYPMAPPYGFGTAPQVNMHSSSVVGTKYGNWSMNCMNCHNPHTEEQNLKYGTTYGKYIKEYICYDNAATGQHTEQVIRFTSSTGTGSFADGTPYTENICNMCHTQTNHHQADGTAPGGQGHNDGQNCMACHAHSAGFKPIGGTPAAPHNTPEFSNNCDYCHVSATDYSSPVPDSKCNQCHTAAGALKAGFPAAPNVVTHSTANGSGNYTYNKTCADCHQIMTASTNLKLVKTNLSAAGGGSNIVFTARTGAGSFADGAPYTGNVCNSCHTMTNHHQADGTAPGGQDHNNSTDCTGCHAHNNGFSPIPVNVPAPHDTAACTACHTTPDTYVVNAAIPNSACNSCHGIGSTGGSTKKLATHFGSTYNDPTTGAALSAKCVECHNPMSAQTNLKFIRSTVRGKAVVFTALTGAGSFADGGAPFNGICEVCHTQTNHHQNDGTAPGGQSHNDGTNCTACHTHGGGFTDQNSSVNVPAPHNTAACTACHTPTDYVVNAPIANSKCNSCHGIGSTGGSTKKLASHFGSTYIDPTTGGYLNAMCVECHNPMSAQSNLKSIRSTVRGKAVVFTALTGAGSFADGGAPYNGICEVCHTQTNHHQNDGTAPGGQSHNDGTNCTTCHTHSGGFTDQNSSVNVPAPHSTQACTTCHTATDYVANAPIANSKCNSCHGIGSTGGSTKKLATHFGSTYNDPTTGAALSAKCVECHNPMSAQSNLRLIRSTVRGKAVVFTALTGAGSFADGGAPFNGICEVCHTQTNHHRASGTAPGGQSHNDGTNCTTCHTHGGGFSDQNSGYQVPAPHNTALCTACHTPTDYVPNAPIANSKCNSCHGIGTTGGSTKKVDTHFSSTYNDPTTGLALEAKCVECHNPMSTQSNLKFIRSTVRGKAVVFTALTGAGSFADGGAPYNGICEVCHTQTNHHQNDGTAPGGQSHNNGTNCTTCHTHGGGFTDQGNTVNVPAPHDTAPCSACHTPTDYVINAQIDNSKCNTCHGIGTTGGSTIKLATHFGSKYNDPTTGAALNVRCVECHNPMRAQSNLAFIRSTIRGKAVVFTAYTGANSFADGGAPYNGVCEVCHTQTNHHRASGTAPGGQSHNDGTDCGLCHKHEGGLQPSGSCKDCHSTTQGNRAAVVGQFSGNSHHVQGVNVTDATCYQCHWEANSDGTINSAYHGGWNAPGSPVNLVVYGNGTRPSAYSLGITAVSYTAVAGTTNIPIVVGNDSSRWPYSGTNQSTANRVYVDSTTPANADGTITSFQLYVTAGSGNIWIFTASKSGNTITPRAVTTVALQGTNRTNTWTGLNLAVKAGDVVGFYSTTLRVRQDSSSTGAVNFTSSAVTPTPGVPFTASSTSTSRAAVYATGTSTVSSGTISRTELLKINQHCLGCHSAQNNTIQPFGDGKTPKQYAWDGRSIAERYSQTGTTAWGKYSNTSSTNFTPKNTQTKAYSAHGNAAVNQRGWNLTETWPNTSGTENVLCFDCHNSHGSTVSGKTTSYTSATANGGILKSTTAGLGGYTMTYKPQAGGSVPENNVYSEGAGICFDCHMTQNSGSKPWGYQNTFGSTQSIMGYFDTPYFSAGLSGPQQRYSYKAADGTFKAGHFGASAPLSKPVMGTVGGLCTPCHDPHGVSPSLGTNQQYAVPLLKGTWITSMYKEDAAPANTNEQRGCTGEKCRDPRFSNSSTPGYYIDQNTFANWSYTSTASVSQSVYEFGGLCLQCHPKSSLSPDTTSTWRSVDRIHNAVKGWDNDGNTMHRYTCSKCHSPHNSTLGRLLVTNCLDPAHRGRVTTLGPTPPNQSGIDEEGQGSGRFPAGGGGITYKNDGRSSLQGPFFFGTTSGGRACHDNTNTNAYPNNQLWNVLSPWGELGSGSGGSCSSITSRYTCEINSNCRWSDNRCQNR